MDKYDPSNIQLYKSEVNVSFLTFKNIHHLYFFSIIISVFPVHDYYVLQDLSFLFFSLTVSIAVNMIFILIRLRLLVFSNIL